MLLQRDKLNRDKLFDALESIREGMPKIQGGRYYNRTGHETKWTHEGTMPKNCVIHEVEQNEKFLNKNQSLIEDNLPKKLLDRFVEYQNWNFQHGMGELTERAGRNYVDTSEHWKEGLFSSCECKEKRQMEKLVRESMIGVDNFGVLPKWASLIPTHTNFAYQALVTFSNAGLNRGGCEDATSEIGGYDSTAYNFGNGVINWTGFNSSITGGVSADTNYNTLKTYFNNSETTGSPLWACMYDSNGDRVGDGQDNSGTTGVGESTWVASVSLGVLCTGDATIRGALGNASGGGIMGQRTDTGGAVTYRDSSWGGGTMNASFGTATGDMYLAKGWKFSFV